MNEKKVEELARIRAEKLYFNDDRPYISTHRQELNSSIDDFKTGYAAAQQSTDWERRCKAAEAILEKYHTRIPDSPEYMNWQELKGNTQSTAQGDGWKAIEFAKWLGENYDFNEFENKWGKFWEIDEGVNSGFDETQISELYQIFKTQPTTKQNNKKPKDDV